DLQEVLAIEAPFLHVLERATAGLGYARCRHDAHRNDAATVPSMGKASDWLREERRNVLGHWSAFCLDCGAARRWFEEFEAELPASCPECGGEMLHRCP